MVIRGCVHEVLKRKISVMEVSQDTVFIHSAIYLLCLITATQNDVCSAYLPALPTYPLLHTSLSFYTRYPSICIYSCVYLTSHPLLLSNYSVADFILLVTYTECSKAIT